MILTIYKVLNVLATPFVWLFIFYRIRLGKEDRARVCERLGRATRPRPQGRIIWIHAASVGETISVMPLIECLVQDPKSTVLFTSGTVTSAKVAVQKLPKKAIHQYVPIENYFAVRKFLKHWQPHLAIFVESEFWPCILSETARVCKIISLSTRTSDASFERWSWCKSFTHDVLSTISVFMPQSVDDAQKLKSFGFNNIKYIGHLKYSVPPLPYSASEMEKMKKETQGRKVLLVASTHPGEEEIAADIYKELRVGEKSLLMLIAVRHPVRAEGVRAMLESRGYKIAMRSKAEEIVPETDIYLIDTIGELGTFFKLAPITIMGGSFVDGIGGHNIIEPAKLRSVVIVGPYMANFKAVCEDFKEVSAAIFVGDKLQCVKAVKLLWKNQKTYNSCRDNALMLFKDKEDVLEKTLDYIVKYYL